ncbi:uncharacterized protein LOC143296451 [Babylonia areolata]|uniref:uncharacterized protein LOC143296451 n=1 Tax=Babylonia areolata TaxID=304850 RepID=UPI003FD20D64
MLTRRGGRDSASSSTSRSRPVSRAQFKSVVHGHPKSQRLPANRLTTTTKPPMTFDTPYSRYEHTSPDRHLRHSDDVVLPPVHQQQPGVRTSASARRPAKRGPRKLPTVKGDPGPRRLAWYHEDGSVNLQALTALVNRHTFPRTQSYFDRLEKIKSRPWPPPPLSPPPLSDDERLVPLRFADDDDELTPRKRAERDSLLNLLLNNADDLTEEELEQIVKYISDQPDAESTPRSCLRKCQRSKSAVEKKKKRSRQSSQERSRSKSVRFKHASPSRSAEMSGPECAHLLESPRPHSAPSPRADTSPNPLSLTRRPSDPFHVPSPAPSPRVLGSPDEVAYFEDMEPPPEIPASPELIPEPKITYYDESGEEIEEEIQTKDPVKDHDSVEDRATSCEDAATCPDQSSPPESSRRPETPLSEADPAEHLPELDTPRVDRDTVDAQERPQSELQSTDSASPRPEGHSISECSDAPNQTVSPRPESPGEYATTEQQCSEPPSNDEDALSSSPKEDVPNTSEKENPTSSLPAEDVHDTPEKEKPMSSPPGTPRPESAPAEQSPRASRKSRPKSAKRHKSARSDSKSADRGQQSPSTDRAREEKNPHQRPPKTQDASAATRPPPERSEPAKEEPQPIPVISLTRGQLAAIPPYSPRIQSADSPAPEPQPKDLTDSVRGQHSPGSSTLQGVESVPDSAGRGGTRGKDNRMKIWLTRTAWNRQVEIVD